MHQESPFPFKTPTGTVITDERCTCGALRSQHENSIAYGHGPRLGEPVAGTISIEGTLANAMIPTVLCAKFTWSHFVFTTLLVPAGFESLDDRHVIKIERANKRAIGAKGYRYEIRDLSKPPGSQQRVLTCTASLARSRREARDHAITELRIYQERRANMQVLDGGAQ